MVVVVGVGGVEKESGKGRQIGGHVARRWGLNGGNKRWKKKTGRKKHNQRQEMLERKKEYSDKYFLKKEKRLKRDNMQTAQADEDKRCLGDSLGVA